MVAPSRPKFQRLSGHMAYEFKKIVRVPFVDTDMAGIVHFSNFFRYMEVAEHEFYRSLGFEIHRPDLEKAVGFPRLHVACKYHSPLFFEDEVEIHLLVREVTERTLRYNFVLRRLGQDPGQVVARGESTIACIGMEKGRPLLKSIPFPQELVSQLEAAPPELLET